MFRDLLGGLKKEAEKRLAEQEDARKREEQNRKETPKPETAKQYNQPQNRNRRTGKYGRLAAWIKSNYSQNFKDGLTSDEIKIELDKIFAELESKGSLSGDAKRGFRSFIDTRKYSDLVKVRE
jgi:hypothetical protein